MKCQFARLNVPGKFDSLIGFFRSILAQLPDKRTGKNSRYGMEDAALSAFGVFFTQSRSFLAYQRSMADAKGRSNAQSLFGVHQIPSDNHIRDLLDEVSPSAVLPVFDEILTMLEQTTQLSNFRSLGGGLLVALDGTIVFRFHHDSLPALLDAAVEEPTGLLFSCSTHPGDCVSWSSAGDSARARVHRAAGWT